VAILQNELGKPAKLIKIDVALLPLKQDVFDVAGEKIIGSAFPER
jgi:hypothetical protein